MCLSITCRSYGADKLGMTSGYKHIAPPEQGSSYNKRDFSCKVTLLFSKPDVYAPKAYKGVSNCTTAQASGSP